MRGIFRTRVWLAVGLATVMTGCVNQPPPQTPVAVGEEPNPVRVTTAPVSHVVHFAAGVATLSSGETLALRAFLHKERARSGETATVAAGSSSLANARRDRVIAVLHQDGLETALAAPGQAPAAATVAVSLERSVAVLPHCPNWPQISGNEPMNLPSSNLGCATALDLAVMVADPQDLVSGRTPGPADAEPGVRAVETYRSGKKPQDEAGAAGASAASTTAGSGGATSGGGNAQ